MTVLFGKIYILRSVFDVYLLKNFLFGICVYIICPMCLHNLKLVKIDQFFLFSNNAKNIENSFWLFAKVSSTPSQKLQHGFLARWWWNRLLLVRKSSRFTNHRKILTR